MNKIVSDCNFSPSTVNKIRSCAYAAKLSHINRAPTLSEKHYDTRLGSKLHEALEYYIVRDQRARRGDVVDTVQIDLSKFPPVKTNLLVEGVQHFVTQIYPWYRDSDEVLCEFGISLKLHKGELRQCSGVGIHRGKIDFLAIRGMLATIIDFKSLETDKNKFQLQYYVACLAAAKKNRPLTAIQAYSYVFHTKSFERVVCISSGVEQQALREYVATYLEDTKEILRQNRDTPTPNPMCRFCCFRVGCPAEEEANAYLTDTSGIIETDPDWCRA